MKNIFTLICLCLSVFCSAQFSSVNVNIIDDIGKQQPYIGNPNTRKAVTPNLCTEDTLEYGRYKGTAFIAVAVSDGYALAQFYDAPDTVEVSGATLYAWAIVNDDDSVILTVNLYEAGVDSLPTGNPIRTKTFVVDSTFGGGVLTSIRHSIAFDSTYITDQGFVITVESSDSVRAGVVCNSYTNGDGLGENLMSGTVGGTWYRGLNLNIGGTTLDCDVLLEPHVAYSTYADLTGPICYNPNDSVSFTNLSSPILFHPMYNRYIFYDLERYSFRWNFGDNFNSFYEVLPKHKYLIPGNYTVRLITTMYGYRSFNCRDTAEIVVNYQPSAIGFNVDTPICSGNDAQLTGLSNATIAWYNSTNASTPLYTGAKLTLINLQADTFLYVQSENGSCRTPRVLVSVPVAEQPGIPSVINDSICLNAQGNLTASVDVGDITWWDSIQGGNQIAAGNVYVSNPLTSSLTYYAEANNRGCISTQRTQGSINVSASNAPNPPNTNTDTLICLYEGDIDLVATTNGSNTINWFDVASGGSPTFTGSSVNYSPTQIGANYIYVEAFDGQCASTRIQKKITTWTFPTKNIKSADTLCLGESLSVDLTDNFGKVRWFDEVTAGTLLFDSNYFDISGLTSSQTFYLEPYSEACSDTVRHPVTIDVLNPGVINDAKGGTICSGESVDLTATTSHGEILWYTSTDTINSIGSGNTFTTENLDANSDFYLRSQNQECQSHLQTVSVNVLPSPRAKFNYQVNSPGEMAFDAVESGLTYAWDFSDGNTSTLKSPSHTFEFNGWFRISLTTTASNDCSSSDTVWVRVSGLTTSVDETTDQNISVFPNPTNQEFTISGINQPTEIRIISLLGQLVYESSSSKDITINSADNDLSPGVYHIIISTETTTQTRKISIY